MTHFENYLIKKKKKIIVCTTLIYALHFSKRARVSNWRKGIYAVQFFYNTYNSNWRKKKRKRDKDSNYNLEVDYTCIFDSW